MYGPFKNISEKVNNAYEELKAHSTMLRTHGSLF